MFTSCTQENVGLSITGIGALMALGLMKDYESHGARYSYRLNDDLPKWYYIVMFILIISGILLTALD